MQAATSPIHGATPVGPSVSPSTAATIPFSSSLDPSHQHHPSSQPHPSGSSIQNNALRFVANHHRQHNPNDPKLRVNPSFKSRRSSLLGSVLKSKSKDDSRKLANTLASARAPPHPIAPKPRVSSPSSHHHHTKSLPTSTSNASVTRHTSSLNLATSPTRTHQLTHQNPSGIHTSTSDAHAEHPHSISHDAKPHLVHLGDSPPTASFPSPTDLPEGSTSTCSSANAKAISLASSSAPLTSLSMDAPFLPTSAPQLSGQAASQHLSGASPAVDAVTADSSPPRPTDAFQTLASQSRFEMQEQGDSAPSSPIPAGTASSRATLTSSHASPTTTTIPAPQASLPIITRTIVPDDSNHIPSQHLSTSPGTTINADLNVVSPPSSSPSYPSTAPSNSGTLEQSLDPAPQRLSQSTSAFVTSPQRFSSLGRKSAARLTLDTDVQSPAELPRGLARDINQELDSPTSPEMIGARTERRMSMLDFLTADPAVNASPQLALASLSAEDLPRSLQPASRTGLRSNVLVPPSIPLVQASHQLRLEAAAARGGGKALQPRKIDLCDHVRVGVEPLIDRLTMFGSMQSSSNYSLAGTVVVEVPKLNVPRLSAAAAVARDGSTSDHPSVHVEALTVRFVGYSVYVDATGRFNSIRLAEISQELLQPQGFSCPVEMVETGESPTSPDDSTANAANRDASQQTLKYETEFDLSIPGWLPASQRSRFGATFYCVQATAIVEGQAILSALSGFDAFGGDGWQSPTSSLNLARSLESELREAADGKNAAERKDGTRSPPASTVKSKTKNTWLNKTAKQLQLRSSKKSTGTEAEQGSSISNSRRGSGSKDVVPASVEQDPLFSKTTEASNQLLPTGQHSIRSECLSILVRRCRDVVPVPVARLARLATASQVMRADGTTPSLSQSMLALARLQDTSDAAAAHPDGSSGSSGSEATASARSHLPTSVSAPMSLAAHAENRQSETARVSVPPANSSIDEAATLSPEGNADAAMSEAPSALAPSPRIDANPRGWGQDPASAASERHSALGAEREIMPRAPSAFDAPRDPAKLAAATFGMTPSATLPNLPSSMSRASSLFDSRFGNANSPPRTSSRSASAGRSSAPLRHFVHRPTLHLPPVLGLTPDKDAAGGLSFSLTLSLPSHVHVAGPKSDLLSFGVQIDLGRTQGWDALKKWGGLRLKDMELVCLQTERHSSMPSRSFCAAFPVPPPPNKVDAADLPVVTTSRKTPSVSNDTQQLAAETRLRQSYDRSLVLGHIELANQGKAPHPIEHNVERIRTTIVGPPPFALKKRCQEVGKEDGDKSRKGKAKININSGNLADRPGGFSRSPSRGSPAGSGTNTPDGSSQGGGISGLRAAFAPAAQVNSGSRMSVMQPRPRALARSNNSSSSSLRQAFQGTDGSGAMQPAPRPSTAGAALASGSSPNGPSRSRRPIPFDLGSASETVTTRRDISASGLDADGADPNMPFADAADSPSQPGSQISRSTARTNSDGPAPLYALEGETQRRITGDGATTRMGVSSSVTTRSSGRPAAAPRRSRFENAISRLSTFASSMLEQPHEVPAAGGSTHDPRASANAPANANGAAAASLRASYAFSGDDGQGVDLTKGRVRMTINLPLVSSDLDAARKAGSAQLISDFESPYVRVRHKLKVKLGFGLKSNVALGEDGEDWAQTLVMCVPVRFTEAPPKEVQEQFGPVRIVPGNAQTAAPVDPLAGDQSRAAECALATGQGSNEDQTSTGTGLPETFAEPLLPAYAQLFREDGSRLADEGEDLPRYPGRMSVVGEIDEDPAPDTGVVDDGHGAMAAANLQASNVLSTVDEAHVSGSSASDLSPVSTMPGNGPHSVFSTELPRDQAATLSRLSNLASVPMLMDRTTSLPGNRLLTRTTSSSVFGLRTSPSHPVLPGSSQSATSSPYVETSSNSNTAVTKSRVGSSAFDPLPARPGMRRRSATTASLVTFSRITPAEVLDEALVTSALDDEEDRMDGMQPSHTLDSLTGRPRRGLGGGMDGSGQDDDDEAEEEELDVEDEDDLDGVDSPEVDSEAGHGMMGMRIHSNGGLSGSEGDGETVDVEVGRAL